MTGVLSLPFSPVHGVDGDETCLPCIALEFSGITHFCWVLAPGLAWVFRMKKEDGKVSINLDKKIHNNNTDKMTSSNEVVEMP